MREKILRRELDVEIAGTDQKPVLVFDGRGKAIFLHVEINGRGYGWQHLRTGYSLKKSNRTLCSAFSERITGISEDGESGIGNFLCRKSL